MALRHVHNRLCACILQTCRQRGVEGGRQKRFALHVSFCLRFTRAGLENSKGYGTDMPPTILWAKLGSRPEQLLGLARAPRGLSASGFIYGQFTMSLG